MLSKFGQDSVKVRNSWELSEKAVEGHLSLNLWSEKSIPIEKPQIGSGQREKTDVSWKQIACCKSVNAILGVFMELGILILCRKTEGIDALYLSMKICLLERTVWWLCNYIINLSTTGHWINTDLSELQLASTRCALRKPMMSKVSLSGKLQIKRMNYQPLGVLGGSELHPQDWFNPFDTILTSPHPAVTRISFSLYFPLLFSSRSVRHLSAMVCLQFGLPTPCDASTVDLIHFYRSWMISAGCSAHSSGHWLEGRRGVTGFPP